MKSLKYIVFIIGLYFPYGMYSQSLEFLGLANKEITSLHVNEYKIAVGTNRNGVFWQEIFSADSMWNHIPLESQYVSAVYPHKSGPIGWAIGAGVIPKQGDSVFVYCSYMGDRFLPKSYGISDTLTDYITKLDGYPDPTICGETYAAGGRVLYRRFWADTVWNPIYTTSIEGHIGTVRVREQYRGVIVAGGHDGVHPLLIKSLDFGESWMTIFPPATVLDVDFAGEIGETIIVATNTALFRSTDAGVHWNAIFQSPELYAIPEVVYDAENGRIFAIAESIILPDNQSLFIFSMDDGKTWDQVFLDTMGPIVDIELDELLDGSVCFAARDAGVFRVTLTTDVEDQQHDTFIPLQCDLDQNYPNPFNLHTCIRYRLSRPMNVRLSIIDINGNTVRCLLNLHQDAGSHLAIWDGTNQSGKPVSNGLYFYMIQADTGVKVRKMIVAK